MTAIDITNLLVLVLKAVVPAALLWMAHIAWAFLAPHLVTYLGEKNMLVFQQRFDLAADKAIGFAVAQGAKRLTAGAPITIDNQNWMVSLAVNYLVQHAPDMATQAGELTEKILARFDSHPAVQGLIGNTPPGDVPATAGS